MPVVPTLDVENYLDFKSMTHYVKAVSSAAPHLVRAFSIGKSKAGRPLLVIEVTNRNLREGRHKPGIWIDGGHQGWNLLGSMACLELLRFLVAGHGRDEFLTDLVDHTVFYVAPRLAPDEAELCLAGGVLVPQQSLSGVSERGRQFRRENPLGGWKPFKRDNRVLVPRNPEDRKGPFYDLYRAIDQSKMLESLPQDFPDPGALTAPLQLPSTRAIFEFMRSYPNVFGVISTSGPGDRLHIAGGPATSALKQNLRQRLSELAGLPVAPVDQALEKPGRFLHWASSTLGVLAADCQMWSLRAAAGLKSSDFEDPYAADENELIQLLRFCEKEFPEGSFSDWTPTEESALGTGEIGGWDWSKTWLNPPIGPYLGRELKKLSRLTLGMASAAPRLAFGKVEDTVVGWSGDQQPLRKIAVQVHNVGYLPTCPLESGKNLEGKLSLNLASNRLLIGQTDCPLRELSGNGSPLLQDGFPTGDSGHLPKSREMSVEFLVCGAAPVELSLSHPLAGTETTTSKPPQGLRPPSFDASTSVNITAEEPMVAEDPFDEVFPSFEDLYQESAPTERAAPPPPAPERPVAAPVAVPVSPPPQQPAAPPVDPFSDMPFNIPDPVPAPATTAKPVTFGKLEEPISEPKQSPFPTQKPSKGRVFGTIPQKPTGGLPAALGSMGSAESGEVNRAPGRPSKSNDGGFSPLPLVKGESNTSSAFEPLAPPTKAVPKEVDIFGADTLGGSGPPPQAESTGEQAAAPPARLSRMSAPQLIRRQRGGQEPFKPR